MEIDNLHDYKILCGSIPNDSLANDSGVSDIYTCTISQDNKLCLTQVFFSNALMDSNLLHDYKKFCGPIPNDRIVNHSVVSDIYAILQENILCLTEHFDWFWLLTREFLLIFKVIIFCTLSSD